ncbi:MAG: glycosyltransferase [Alphaproteobacteria bacterium]|nr:glycosyltransferase [Alphaproteobacteria bacterium]
MSTNTPRVSVLTPIYNTKPEYLREMIESILNQTYTDFEFLILNDSPDNKEIEKIVLDYAKNDKRIKYSKNDKNMGITPSRNKLLKMAKGEYLAIFDHDDISVPTRLEQEVAYLDTHPYIGVVSGWLEKFGDKRKNGEIWSQPEYDSEIRISLMHNCHVMHTASMLRKSVLTNNNIEYEEFYTPAEDYRLWARLMDVTHFYNIQNVLVKYRWFGNNTSKRMETQREEAAANIRMELCGKYPEYAKQVIRTKFVGTVFRLRLFGKIPLLKIKNNWILLFEFIPVCKLLWR